ncbi:uncharacterized protein LOC131324543 isoform X2 [Rhododendron vialii]|uniref:uncharacterized protein LOC131324543 isoform X2 n=1 Tax=Rhododendron vialii TaxID=182163 RepID=UPI00265F8EB3|nr:uncharacterized protein LOC131324543 isoform X2 [Rhododendron vialii]
MFVVANPLPYNSDENVQGNNVKFPMARKADLVKIGKEAFDILDKMPQQPLPADQPDLIKIGKEAFDILDKMLQLPADQEAKHYELPNALKRWWLKPQKNHDIGAQSTAALVITKRKNKGIPIFGK